MKSLNLFWDPQKFQGFHQFFRILFLILIEINSMWLCLILEPKTLIDRVLMWTWSAFLFVRIVMLIQCTFSGIGTVILQWIAPTLYYHSNIPLSRNSLLNLSNDKFKDAHHANKEKLKKTTTTSDSSIKRFQSLWFTTTPRILVMLSLYMQEGKLWHLPLATISWPLWFFIT